MDRGKMKRLMALHTHHIEALQQPAELALAPADHAIMMLAWPLELRLFQTFVPETESGLIPIQDLEPVAVAVAEHVQSISKRVQVHLLFNTAAGFDIQAPVRVRVMRGCLVLTVEES